MRALVCESPGHVVLRELPDPEPGPGEVVVRVEATLTCGTDLKLVKRGHPKVPFPTVLGHEFCGRVLRVGAGAPFSEGERVTSAVSAPCGACRECHNGHPNLCGTAFDHRVWGTWAELVKVPARIVRYGLQRARDGLDERAAGEGDVRRKEERIARDGRGRHPHVLGEASGVEAGGLPFRAHDGLPRGAETADAARGVVVDEDPVPRPQVRHADARLDDDARGFVPEDSRGLRRHVPRVDVAPAEADGLHRHEDLAGTGPGRLHLDDLDPPRGAGERRFHPGRDHGRNATFISIPRESRSSTNGYCSSGLSAVTRRSIGTSPRARRSSDARASSAV